MEHLLESWFPGLVACVLRPAGDETGDLELWPEEHPIVANAVARRRREFALGRHAARRALVRLGREPAPIPRRRGREPLWPEGTVGSITHCDGLVAAVVAPARDYDSIGIDAEPALPLPTDVVERVLLETERSRTRADEPHPADWARVIFSAKECVHKCVFPVSGITLDFLDVELVVGPATGEFSVRPAGILPEGVPDLSRLAGRYVVQDGFVLAAAVLRQPR